MLTLLLAAAVAAAPQCDDFAGSSPYQVTNVTQMGVMGFTTEGEGVVAMCVGPVDDGRVQLLDAFKGNVKEVTEAKCANYMVVTGQDVATMASEGISSEAPVMFVPLKDLNGSLPVQSEVRYSGESVNCLVSNGVSITAVCYSTSSPLGPYVQTIDNQGHMQFPFNTSNSVSSATVSKMIGNSFGYYVATWNQPETSDSYIYVYSSAGSVLHTYTLIPGTQVLAMRFRDEANTLVVVCVSHSRVRPQDWHKQAVFSRRLVCQVGCHQRRRQPGGYFRVAGCGCERHPSHLHHGSLLRGGDDAVRAEGDRQEQPRDELRHSLLLCGGSAGPWCGLVVSIHQPVRQRVRQRGACTPEQLRLPPHCRQLSCVVKKASPPLFWCASDRAHCLTLEFPNHLCLPQTLPIDVHS
eukprot:TRINITY_DN1747_c1_g1_i1.p1 TRINITY_DN1747_c1_g1~~TRINITY_DN1747_c1_g1_i1.p1  ORF type:complete len:408 (+),score=2.45 TRINITY_DN1747_c1_g1_i1:43-1266(+)